MIRPPPRRRRCSARPRPPSPRGAPSRGVPSATPAVRPDLRRIRGGVRPGLHARQRRDRPLLPAEVMGAGVALVRLRQRRRPRRLPRAGRPLRERGRRRAGRGRAECRLFRNDLTRRRERLARRCASPTSPSAPASRLRGYGMGVAVGDYDNDGYRRPLRHRASVPRRCFTTTATARSPMSTAQAGVGDALLEHERRVRRLRSRRRSRPVRRALPRLHDRRQQAVQRLRSARATTAARARYQPVPDRLFRNDGSGRFADVTESRRHRQGRRRRARRRDRRLQRRRLARSVRRQRRDAEPALDQPARTARSSDEGLLSGRGAERGTAIPRAAWASPPGDFDRRRRRGSLRHQHRRRDLGALRQRRARATSRTRARGRAWRAPTAAFTGFGTDWFDYDNDGWLDLFVANGAVNIVEAQRGQPTPFRMTNQLFHNLDGPALRARRSARGGPGVRARRDRPRRGVRRHRQRRRRRHRRHEQRRTGAAAAQPVAAATEPLADGAASTRRRATGSRSARWIGVERAGRPTLWRRVQDRRQLSVGERRARALRPRIVGVDRRGRRACGRTGPRSAGPASPATARSLLRRGQRTWS